MPAMKEHLTGEYLKGLFKSNFELANSAIKLARFYVKSGHEVNAEELLEKIARNPNQLEIEMMMEEDDEEKEMENDTE